MKIYNTMSGKTEEFVPLHSGSVNIYACGPTVYDKIHIGNARQICTFDTLRRYLQRKDYNVKYVQNFTDMDDKIIRRAAETGKTAAEVSEAAIREYFTDAHGLNITDADVHPKVTENMDAIIDIVKTLADGGYVYESEGPGGDTPTSGIYFDISKFAEYGKLSHRFDNTDGLLSDTLQMNNAAGRMDDLESAKKRNAGDFAVWKAAKAGEPSWEAVIGGKTYNGRPGWHIECSAMSRKFFASPARTGTLDIHGGGSDLIFPHHENEIAQSEAATGEPLAKYWMHNAMLTIQNEKMAKSRGNFFFVRDIAEKYGYMPLRLFLISAHYRSPLNYSEQSLTEAVAGLSRISNCVGRLGQLENDGETVSEEAKAMRDKVETDFDAQMDNDLNTAGALGVIYDFVRTLNKMKNITFADGELCGYAIAKLLLVLGIKLSQFDEENSKRQAGAEIPDEVNKLKQEYIEARQAKNYAAADDIRTNIAALGYAVSVTRGGVTLSKA